METMTKEMNKIIQQIKEMSPDDLVIHILAEIDKLKKACKQDDESQKILNEILAKEKIDLFEYAKRIKDKLDANDVDPLTPCGHIFSAIGWGDGTISQIPYDYTDDYLNFFSAFPLRFGLLLINNPQALPVTLLMMNRALYTLSLAAKWYTSGQIPLYSSTTNTRNGGYNQGATVQYNGVMYTSLVNNNTHTPSNDYQNWKIANSEFPIGRILFSPNANADDGFLLANGANLSKTTYANLWNYAQHVGAVVPINQWQLYIGFFGDIDGDLFRIPDLRGRYLRSANSGTNYDPRRTSTEVGTYKTGNILQHNHVDAGHTHTDAGHTHTISTRVTPQDSADGVVRGYDGVFENEITSTGYANIQTGHADIQNTGTDQNSVNDIAYTIQIKY